MPLRDHFHPPWSEQNPWEGFHSAWINTMVRRLNRSLLPPQFRAVPQIHLGPMLEGDITAWQQQNGIAPSSTAPGSGNGEAAAVWSPPEATQTLEIELPIQDVFEVRVFDDFESTRLVAVIELVSPGNKDRPESRRAFATKCAAYLHAGVNLVVIDVAGSRHFNMHHELLELLSLPHDENRQDELYAVSYRSRNEQTRWHVDTWPATLEVDAVLPTVPLSLTETLAVPLDLETTYEETREDLRIH